MKKLMLFALLPAVALVTFGCNRSDSNAGGGGKTASASVPNPAMSQPDQVAWNLFIQAVTPTNGLGTAFESWPSDHDTFQPNAQLKNAARDGLDARIPVIPAVRRGNLNPAVLGGAHNNGKGSSAADAAASGAAATAGTAATPAPAKAKLNIVTPPIVPNPQPPANEPGSGTQVVEEVRRNPTAFNYIVSNGLNSRSGLMKAFNSISQGGQVVNFPSDSIEVKTNWIPVSALPQYYPGSDPSQFYLATDMVQGQSVQYALIAMHVISKQVPSWTWATFEHQANPGRCDFLGCKDNFGAVTPYVAPANNDQGGNQGTTYAACQKTPALQAAFAAVPNLNPAFANYCLKGTQTDYIDDAGLAVRVGNSVTENGFVPQASCMTCHGSANFDASGQATTGGGFIGNNTFVGPINPTLYYSGGDPSTGPFYEGQPGIVVQAVAADFVWSIPFCAYDDVTNPGQPAPSQCASK